MRKQLLKFGLPAGLTILVGSYWFAQRAHFPYGRHSNDVQITQKKDGAAAHQTSVYTIKAGKIEGEAVLISAPTVSLGQSVVNSQIVGVSSTFENSRAPYAGHITAEVDCKAKDFVKEENVPFGGAQTKLILAVASARRIFGSCSIGEIGHASGFWAGYDQKRKQVLTVKLFKQVSGPSEIAASQLEIMEILKKIIN